MTRRPSFLILALTLLLSSGAGAQVSDDLRDLKLRDWQPRSMLRVERTDITRAKFPIIDIHTHLGGGKQTLTPERVRHYLDVMDATGVQTVVNLDGGWDERLEETLDALDRAHPGRFLTYARINFEGIDDEGWTACERSRLEAGFKAGAKGLKIAKSLGLGVRYKDGRFMPVDDPKLDPLWDLCGQYGRPIVIHTGDPSAFFTPHDSRNERLLQLNDHPDWSFHGGAFPSRDELHAQRLRVIARHPKTTFICAHMANDGEDLAQLGTWLDQYPNMYTDIDARISELGRQPYSARRFLIKYQDRILFGTDTVPEVGSYQTYFRFLETDDEYFPTSRGYEVMKFWMIYGVFLPDDVLVKLYRTNAERLVFGLDGPPRGDR